MTQLSRHFQLSEFTASAQARALGDANEPTAAHLANLKVTALGLEQVRRLVGGPVRITSGYRNPRVNKAVGGVANSAHALGFAADINTPGVGLKQLAERIRDSKIAFDQLIYEHGRTVHISFDPRLRQQVLTQRGGPGSPVVQGIVD